MASHQLIDAYREIGHYLADLDPPNGRQLVLADVPFLEGAVAAGVAASGGFALAAVANAAQEARDVRKF